MSKVLPSDAGLDDAFLRAVLVRPDDDGPRLVMADDLDERGEAGHAELIRLQCRIAALERNCSCGRCVRLRGGGQHTNGPCAVDQARDELPDGRSCQAFLRRRESELLVAVGGRVAASVARAFGADKYARNYGYDGMSGVQWEARRGFVESVTLPTVLLVGGPCGRCSGTGRAAGTAAARPPRPRSAFGRPMVPPVRLMRCSDCVGTGVIESVARELFLAAPVREVVLSDREPEHVRVRAGDQYGWGADGNGAGHAPHHLPAALFALLSAAWADTRGRAMGLLSVACLVFGRRAAGLMP